MYMWNGFGVFVSETKTIMAFVSKKLSKVAETSNSEVFSIDDVSFAST